MKPSQQGKPPVKVVSLHKKGTTIYNSTFGEVTLEVYRPRGSKLFYAKVDNTCKGVTFLNAYDCWMWLSEYLSVAIEEISNEDKTLDKGTTLGENASKKKKRGQSKWKN